MVKHVRELARPAKAALRSQQILLILYRYGLAGTLGSLGIELGRRGLRTAGVSKAPAKRLDAAFGKNLAAMLIKLGPTFIKLGQILASRADLVGEPVAEELRVLFNQVPPVSFASIKKVLKKELGAETLHRAFQFIDKKALAAASLSQTHRAVLSNGAAVVLKVQKPGVDKTVELDLFLLEKVVKGVHALHPKSEWKRMFSDFKQATMLEIDYLQEARNIERFQKNYRKVFSTSNIRFPKYYPELTTRRVLTLEPMSGRPVKDLKKGSTVARLVAEQSLAAVLEQIFDHGFFHADPHAGNLFFEEDSGQLGFIDLGLVGQLNPEDKRKFLKVILAVLNRDQAKLANALYAMADPGPRANLQKFEQEIGVLLENAKRQGMEKLRLEPLISKLLQIAAGNDLRIPNRYVMMIRSCLVAEGLARSLHPQISIFKTATPIVAKSLMRSYNPLIFFRRR